MKCLRPPKEKARRRRWVDRIKEKGGSGVEVLKTSNKNMIF
jgi:hypothetical protein